MRAATSIYFTFFLALLLTSCGNDNNYTAVRMEKKIADNSSYYSVTLDLENFTHQRVGKAYAEAIVKINPNYPSVMDAYLYNTLLGYNLSLEEVISRAIPLYDTLEQDYKDEIVGFQEIFNSTIDIAGDGILSKNEVLVLQLSEDVMSINLCSASAAYGSSSITGSTLIQRNQEWPDDTQEFIAPYHAVTHFRQGEKSIVLGGYLGLLFPVTAFSEHHFVSVNHGHGALYPESTVGLLSYTFDLRFALETIDTSIEIANHIKDKPYTLSRIIFVADKDSALVVENDLNPESTGRGIRHGNSTLRDGVTWGINDAIATLNDFILPGNYYIGWLATTARWASYKTLYSDFLATNGALDVNAIKAIASYNVGYDSWYTDGSIYIANGGMPTFQSYVVDMKNFEVWAYFIPVDSIPAEPTFIKLYDQSPF